MKMSHSRSSRTEYAEAIDTMKNVQQSNEDVATVGNFTDDNVGQSKHYVNKL